MSKEALDAFELLEHIYQTHIEENLNEAMPDTDEDVFALMECRTAIRSALTQAAEIERGDKVVVPSAGYDQVLNSMPSFHSSREEKGLWVESWYPGISKLLNKITASEGK